jgi:hypothetical protein
LFLCFFVSLPLCFLVYILHIPTSVIKKTNSLTYYERNIKIHTKTRENTLRELSFAMNKNRKEFYYLSGLVIVLNKVESESRLPVGSSA